MTDILRLAWQGEIPCLFRLLTGLYCPGCGGTRAVKALLRGHIVQSFMYHPLVPYLAASALFLFICFLVCRRQRKPFPGIIWKTAIFIGLFLLTANFLVKNELLLRNLDILARLDQAAGYGSIGCS